MTLIAGTRLGPYEITSAIGAGGMGEVYRARDSKLQRDVAIKVLPEFFASDPERLARFEREAQSLAALNHPNIAQVFGVIEKPPALAMELVEGEDLSQRIARGALPLDEALPIAKQIAAALEAAHERGIVHRDLKPANIKVRGDGTVKVLDFGLAKAMDSSSAGQGFSPAGGDSPKGLDYERNSPTFTSPAMTQIGVILGTAAYMAPEQAKGRRVDKRADIWAFGAVLFEMLTGRRPFGGEDVTEVIASVVKDEPHWALLPPTTPHAITRLIRRCLVKDPQQRLRDIGDARLDLASLEEVVPIPRGNRRGLGTVAILMIVLASLSLGALGAWGVARTQQRPSRPASARLSMSIAPAESLVGGFVLSPDGSQLAFVGQLAGKNQIFLRRMDGDDAGALPGTEGVSLAGPSFSPDGRWLVFTAISTLKKVPVNGGPVTILGENVVGGGSRPVWGADHTIVFSNPMRGLSSIPAAGGTPTVLTTPDSKKAELVHEMPWILPDGKTILFSIRNSTVATGSRGTTIVAHTLETGARRELFPGVMLGVVGDDQLIVGRDDTVMSMGFDTKRLEVVGEPAPLLRGVRVADRGMFSRVPQLTIARNGTIVYLPAGAADFRALMMTDRSGASSRIAAPEHNYSDPKISPDGNRIAVHVFEEGRDNWIFDLRTGASTRLTFDVGEDETPVWSPDGKWIYWTSTRENVSRAIYRKSSDGTGPEQKIWTGDPHVHLGGLTPDGAKLVVSMIQGQHIHLASIGTADGKLTPLLTTPFRNTTPALSPDGRWLAYASDESGQPEVYVQPFPSMQGRTQVSAGGGLEPVWSRSSPELYYRGRGKLMAVGLSTVNGFSRAVPLVDDRLANPQGEDHTGYDVTADGRFVMVSRPSVAEGAVTHLKVIYRP